MMLCKAYPKLGEKVYSQTLPNGLGVFVIPKPSYNKAFAAFSTDYGGADRRFKYAGEWIDTPAGVAHFLEHKMFDTENGNALNILSANGASPNAWTSSSMTAYHFECTENFGQNLETLLSFVSVPYFTAESVQKEQGIIGQEIRMMEDNPGYAVYYNLLKALYSANPLRDSVAGTVESIAKITDQTLYACHRVFYNPSNMVLCVAGDVEPERIVETALSILPETPGEKPERDYGPADAQALYSPVTDVQMEVSLPQFLFGLRLQPAPKGADRLRQELLGRLALEYLMGRPSRFFTELYAKGLIKNDFGTELVYSAGSAVIAAGGESRQPQAVLDELRACLKKLKQDGVDTKLFEKIHRTQYGDDIRALGNFSALCFGMAGGYFSGYDPLGGFELLESISAKDMEDFIISCIDPEAIALSVVSPLAK